MISLLISMAALVLGYFLYGKFVEKVFGPDPARKTPALSKTDGLDYVPMPGWKIFMIQFLNIAGTGPIFGAIMGALFGPSSYLWIVFGCIFGGAVHDYFSGMLSVRGGGANLPDIIGQQLGNGTRKVMMVFSVVMLLLVGTVFVYSPALILGDIAGDGSATAIRIWTIAILLYYMLATFLPIDKLIGKIYPVFAFALLFMAAALFCCLLIKWPSTQLEFWDGLANRSPQSGSIFPCLFITIACGAISGFHGTQSPIMARCMKNEKLGRPIFYGSMIVEGIVALIWAAVASYFFYGGGHVEMGAEGVKAAPAVVTTVSKYWLGTLGGILAILGVVAAPITSGDTALRSARLILADTFKLDQKPIRNRFLIAIPIFIGTALLLWFSIADADGFNIIWRYFGWANQTLAVFTLWAVTAYLCRNGKGLQYLIAMLPAAFMTSVCLTFICTAKIGFNIPAAATPWIGSIVFCLGIAGGLYMHAKLSKKPLYQ